MKKLIIFDVDNTIVKGQSQRLLLSYLYKNKKISPFYFILVLIWFIAYKFHIVRNPRKIVSFAYSFIKGKSISEIDIIMNDFFNNSLKNNLFPGAINEIEKFKMENDDIVLISNASSIVVKPLAEFLCIKKYFCTELDTNNGIYSGKIVGDIMYGENKKNTIIKYAKDNGYRLDEAYAYGDHISDLYVLDIVGHPVVVNPISSLDRIAMKRHWQKRIFKLIQ